MPLITEIADFSCSSYYNRPFLQGQLLRTSVFQIRQTTLSKCFYYISSSTKKKHIHYTNKPHLPLYVFKGQLELFLESFIAVGHKTQDGFVFMNITGDKNTKTEWSADRCSAKWVTEKSLRGKPNAQMCFKPIHYNVKWYANLLLHTNKELIHRLTHRLDSGLNLSSLAVYSLSKCTYIMVHFSQ